MSSDIDFLHKIENINQYIQNIEMCNYKYDEDGFEIGTPCYKITIYTSEYPTGGKTKYEFCMDSIPSSFESFGWYYKVDSPVSYYEEYSYFPHMESDNLPIEVNNYFGEKIENINIYEIPLDNNETTYVDSSGGSVVMEINLENNKKFHFGMYNEHNGYHSHDVWLNVYKDEDIEPTRVVFREL